MLLVTRLSRVWRAIFGISALWASGGYASSASLGMRAASAAVPTVSIVNSIGEPVELVSMQASSVVVGPLVATRLELDIAPHTGLAELRVALPPRAALLEWDRSKDCCVSDSSPSLVSGTWTKRLEPSLTRFGFLYAQPLEHGRAVVVSAPESARARRLGVTLTDNDGYDLAEPLVLTDTAAAGDVVVELESNVEAYRAGDLAMLKVSREGKLVSAPLHDVVVAIDTSASSGETFARRIEQARAAVNAVQGKLALVAFDQASETLFKGESKDLPESVFETLARRGALGATDLQRALGAIEVLLRQREFKRVVLLSDGVVTVGPRDRAALSALVARWAKYGVRRLDAVAPEFGSNRSLLEALVTAGLSEHGRVASASDNFEQEFGQPYAPDVPIAISRAITQSPWALMSPRANDERWVLAVVPEGIPLSVRVGSRAARAVKSEPGWRPLFERYFEQQGLRVSRSPESKNDLLVLKHGKLSMESPRHVFVTRCGCGDFVSGRLPPESIQRIIRQNFGRFRGCAVQNHQAPLVPKGRVTVRFVINLDGQVSSVQDIGSTVSDPGFVRCVMGAFTVLRFAALPEGPITVVYPLVFSDDEEPVKTVDETSYSQDIPQNYVPVKLTNADYPLLPRDVGTEAYQGAFRSVMQAIAEKHVDDAEKVARAALERQPRSLAALLALGKAAEARGNLAEARRAFGSLLDHFPASARVHRVAAAWLSHLGDRESRALAIEALRAAIRLTEGRADSERELAWLLVQEGDYDAALEQLTAAYFHLEDRAPDLLSRELALLASTMIARHPERSAALMAQLKRTGAPLISGPVLVFALQNETGWALELSIYANPERGRFRGIRYADRSNATAFEVAAAERQAPYTLRIADRLNRWSSGSEPMAFGNVRILDSDGRGKLRVELRPFVLQQQGSEVDLASYE